MKWFKSITWWEITLAAIVVATLAGLGIGLGGCSGFSVQPSQLQNLAAQTEQLSGKIDDLQAQTKTTLQSLQASGTVDANTVAKVDKIQSSIDSVQAKTVQIADAVKNATYTSPSSTATTLIEGAQAANAASAPWNPYAPIIDLGLGLAAAAATVIARKNGDTATTAQANLTAHQDGVALTMKQVSQSPIPEVKAVETQLYQNISNAKQAAAVTG
jgi:outer membrane murein-binding lipoprotein Lpp